MCDYCEILKREEEKRNKAIKEAQAGNTEEAVQILLTNKTSTNIELIKGIYLGRLLERKFGNHFNTKQLLANYEELAEEFPKEIFSGIEMLIKINLVADEEISVFSQLVLKHKNNIREAEICWEHLKKEN